MKEGYKNTGSSHPSLMFSGVRNSAVDTWIQWQIGADIFPERSGGMLTFQKLRTHGVRALSSYASPSCR
ncbi:MAG: hypothetical protein WC295_09720, partial [Methanoregula sp.]